MPQNKYKLPEDLKTACISYVRGYKRYMHEYNQKRESVLNSQKNTSYSNSAVSGYNGSNEPYNKTMRLEEIENHLDTKIMRAVERATQSIGYGISDEEERERLKKAVIDCCKERRNFVFRYYALDMDKSTFYRCLNKFLYEISINLKENQ